MARPFEAPLGANAHTPFAVARRAIACVALVLAACGEQPSPTSPARPPRTTMAATDPVIAATEITADAIGRILPALEKDALVLVGNALRALDAKLSDSSATTLAKDRAAATLQNVLGQFTDPARGDAADLDAMRLEVDEIRAALR